MTYIQNNLMNLISNKKLTFLAGAGCSRNSPSNLPTGAQMMNTILKFSCHSDYINDFLEQVDEGMLRF